MATGCLDLGAGSGEWPWGDQATLTGTVDSLHGMWNVGPVG